MIPCWLGSNIPYQEALDIQEDHVGRIHVGEAQETLFLLEHSPVYTIGRTRNQSSLGDSSHLPHPVYEINRGGQATYHGPGQLVGYPILNLRNYGQDLHAYLRLLEESLIAALADYDVIAEAREGLTGVWVQNRKIASIGVGVRKWVSMHGFALNVTAESLPPFLHITPCGLEGVTTTCLHNEISESPSPQEVGERILHHLRLQLQAIARISPS
ncbi:MAG TPA: octanoyltransferase [Verrucomicrobiales bacterium]|nr:octanoyltransferase [Verrucomicrobiales bacterium]HCQ37767.1 octanoyltransferase [Verrucomicrobiales bacterium]